MHPISEDRGFTAEIKLDEIIKTDHLRIVRSPLNAGATLDRVQRAGKDATHYFIHRDLYKTLALIRARTLMLDYSRKQIEGGAGERFGGSVTEHSKAIEHHPKAADNEDDDDAESAQESRARYVAQLLEALRLDPATYQRLEGNAFTAAVAANEAFTRARQSNKALDDELTARDEQARISFDHADSLFKNRMRPGEIKEL
jgi:hypothetical protein